jgi:hypothetical protein
VFPRSQCKLQKELALRKENRHHKIIVVTAVITNRTSFLRCLWVTPSVSETGSSECNNGTDSEEIEGIVCYEVVELLS